MTLLRRVAQLVSDLRTVGEMPDFAKVSYYPSPSTGTTLEIKIDDFAPNKKQFERLLFVWEQAIFEEFAFEEIKSFVADKKSYSICAKLIQSHKE